MYEAFKDVAGNIDNFIKDMEDENWVSLARNSVRGRNYYALMDLIGLSNPHHTEMKDKYTEIIAKGLENYLTEGVGEGLVKVTKGDSLTISLWDGYTKRFRDYIYTFETLSKISHEIEEGTEEELHLLVPRQNYQSAPAPKELSIKEMETVACNYLSAVSNYIYGLLADYGKFKAELATHVAYVSSFKGSKITESERLRAFSDELSRQPELKKNIYDKVVVPLQKYQGVYDAYGHFQRYNAFYNRNNYDVYELVQTLAIMLTNGIYEKITAQEEYVELYAKVMGLLTQKGFGNITYEDVLVETKEYQIEVTQLVTGKVYLNYITLDEHFTNNVQRSIYLNTKRTLESEHIPLGELPEKIETFGGDYAEEDGKFIVAYTNGVFILDKETGVVQVTGENLTLSGNYYLQLLTKLYQEVLDRDTKEESTKKKKFK